MCTMEKETTLCLVGGETYGGWIQKKGRGRGLTGLFGFFRPWSLRYVTVNPGIGLMSYYKREVDGETRRDEAGHVHLKDAVIKVKNNRLIIEIEVRQEVENIGLSQELVRAGEILFLKAVNDEQMRDWVSILSSAST